MRAVKVLLASFIFIAVTGCSTSNRAPDVADGVRQSLNQAGLGDIDVDQNRDTGVVTLTGDVSSEQAKSQAESIAKSQARDLVVSNQIAVRPPGNEGRAETIDSSLDDAIENNFKAVLTRNKLDEAVNYDVNQGVITLTGDVNSQSTRALAEKLAKDVPNVKQVVNELQVRGQKATASN